MMSLHLKKILARLTAVLIALASLQALAASQPVEHDEKWEYTRKAEILKNLFKVVTWPSDNPLKDTVNVCVMGGKSEQMKYLQNLNGQMVDKHKLAIKTAPNLAQMPTECVVIFIAQSEQENQAQIIKHYADKPVLLVADIESFAKKGGSMNFWILNGKVAITANLESLAKSHLKLDLKAFDQVTLIPEGVDLPKD